MKKIIMLLAALLFSFFTQAADYKIDIKGQHAFIQFRVKHLGYSWLLGRFNRFDGHFSYDADNPNKAKIAVEIDTKSVDSNHAARDKHLRDSDFLNVKKYPKAKFVSSSYRENADGSGVINGQLTLNGVSKKIQINTEKIGEGKDPWGGYRVGFAGKTSFKLKDYNIKKYLGPASTIVYLELHIEGVRVPSKVL